MLVSVVIPTFNRALTVLGAVESALGQTYPDLEVIVVDDGSTDTTTDALLPVLSRISLIHQSNAGPSAARNRGVAESKGEIIAFLDSDDQWKPSKIAKQVELMRKGGTDMCCCICNATVRGVDGEVTGNTFEFAGISPGFDEGEWTNPQEVLATRFILFNQVVAVRRTAFEKVGGFNADLRMLEDYEIALKLSSLGKWGVIREPLVIKYNDTYGIGVECMMNREMHAKVRGQMIAGFLENGGNLSPRARMNLERSLADLRMESFAIAMATRGGGLYRFISRSVDLWLRSIRAGRRRCPGWPRFQGNPVDNSRSNH